MDDRAPLPLAGEPSGRPSADDARLGWRGVREALGADHARLVALLCAADETHPRHAWLHPSFVCVALYRIARECRLAGHPRFARLLWHLNVLATGADIPPQARLGPGLVVMAPAGTAIMGKAGRNLTVMPCSGLGAEVGRLDDIGGGPGMCVLGDDVVLEPHSGVLGPVRVGSRVRVGACIGVTRDVPDDTHVVGPPPRFLARGHPPDD